MLKWHIVCVCVCVYSGKKLLLCILFDTVVYIYVCVCLLACCRSVSLSVSLAGCPSVSVSVRPSKPVTGACLSIRAAHQLGLADAGAVERLERAAAAPGAKRGDQQEAAGEEQCKT